MRPLLALLCLIPLMAAAPSFADEDDDDDHDAAREAVEHGAAVPLAEVLARPELRGLGELVRVRLVRDERRWTYRLRFVDGNGQIRDREADATRGAKSQGRR